jgi:predicted deacylase
MDSIIKKESKNPGKTLAVFCGVHGNEKVGVFAVEKAIKNLEIKSGSVYFVFANPEAIEKDVRFTEKNLNRCFVKNQKGVLYEEKRAVELMDILDRSDALLDVHCSINPDTTPFAIADGGFDIVKNMNFGIVATGFDDVEPGAADGYMKNDGKIGICVECGYFGDSRENTDLAYDSIIQFLQYFKAIDKLNPENSVRQKMLHIDGVQKVTSKDFKLARLFSDFETLPENTVIATDGSKEYAIGRERVILFGVSGQPVGAEAYILGTWM